MLELLPVSVGVGLVVSLLFTEFFGLAAGGMVVPGYIALSLNKPGAVIATLLAGLITFWLVHGVSSVTILYGRRRTAVTILFGYTMGYALRILAGDALSLGPEYDVIGYIIPGLIAIWILRQGIIETFASIMVVSIVCRLVITVVLGEELILLR